MQGAIRQGKSMRLSSTVASALRTIVVAAPKEEAAVSLRRPLRSFLGGTAQKVVEASLLSRPPCQVAIDNDPSWLRMLLVGVRGPCGGALLARSSTFTTCTVATIFVPCWIYKPILHSASPLMTSLLDSRVSTSYTTCIRQNQYGWFGERSKRKHADGTGLVHCDRRIGLNHLHSDTRRPSLKTM